MSALAPWLTEDALAAKVAAFALRDLGGHVLRILEPSAGEGALIRGVLAHHKVEHERFPELFRHQITAIELHRGRAQILRDQFPDVRVIHRCFLSWFEDLYEDGGPTDPPFDVAIMNPPYDDGQDASHVEAASVVAKRVTCLVRGVFLHGSEDRAAIFEHCRVIRMAICKARPQFIDREADKQGSPRHDFSVITLERQTGRKLGWDRARTPIDPVEIEWW